MRKINNSKWWAKYNATQSKEYKRIIHSINMQLRRYRRKGQIKFIISFHKSSGTEGIENIKKYLRELGFKVCETRTYKIGERHFYYEIDVKVPKEDEKDGGLA